MPVFIDLETRSYADIKECGGWHYAQHPSTELVCGVALVGSVVYAWSPWYPKANGPHEWHSSVVPPAQLGLYNIRYSLSVSTEPPQEVIDAARDQGAVAHNADNFDAVVWEEFGYPTIPWEDSMDLVRRRGLPGGLGKIAHQLYGVGKDDEGRKAMLALAKPQKVGKRTLFVPPAGGLLRDVMRYCLLDVLLLAAIWRDENLGAPHPDDDVLRVHRVINQRGMLVDVESAKAIQDVERAHKDKVVKECALEAADLRSTAKLAEWLSGRGVVVVDCRKETIRKVLATSEDPEVRAVCRARLAVAKITSGKAAAAERSVCRDGRLRGVMAYYGAATTGRWAGRLIQPHNLPRPPKDLPVDIHDHPEDAPLVAQEIGVEVEKVIGGMLRGLVLAPEGKILGMADFSGIEARMLLWLAGDEEGLDVYREGRDPYRELAADEIYNIPLESVNDAQRTVGKVGVLACGYQGGPGAVTRFADGYGVDLLSAGVVAGDVVEAWRDANPKIAGERNGRTWTTPGDEPREVILREGGLWRDLKGAAETVVRCMGSPVVVEGRCGFRMRGPHLCVGLPSGRELVYRDARYETVEALWGGKVSCVTYQSSQGFRKSTFGGLWAENLAQAVSRDLLGHALVNLEDRGFKTILHVHDEAVVELDHASQLGPMIEAMCELPAWAEGFPLDADGFVAKRYGK